MMVLGFPASAPTHDLNQPEPGAVLRTLTLSALAVAATALGLYIGRELRIRYKFRRRTPSDFFSKAGTRPKADYEYGMGV